MKQYKVLILLIVFTASCCAQENLQDLQFLLGTWQVEDKNSYESWQEVSDAEFSGKSYKLVDGEQKISETISLTATNGGILYEPTVPDQNEGKAIPFVLNKVPSELFSFENRQHDFPKKIQYKPLDTDTLWVNVRGDGDQGFSYKLIRRD